jgi:prepilin-type N-terminal cleavage/methylation domain-containing protein
MLRWKDINGMTLLEVTISLFILAIGLLGLAGLQLVTLRSDTLGHQATLAATLAKAKLVELQKAEQLTEGADQYIDKTDGMTYARQWSVHYDEPQPEMTTVRVQVSWQGELVDRVVTVSAVAAQTAGDEAGGGFGQRTTSGLGKEEGA